MSEITTAKLFTLKPHPYSMLFPPAFGGDYDHLLQSIKREKRLRYSVIVYDNHILDGNQRIRACREARVEPQFNVFEGTPEQALNLVMDLNLARRQLNASQKGTVVAKATLLYERGRPDDEKLRTGAQLTGELAEKAGVSVRTVVNAKKVLREGTNDEIKALETGKAKAKPLAEAIRRRTSESDVAVDEAGTVIPKNSLPFWNRKPEARNVLNQISSARGQVKKLSPDDPMWSSVNLNGVLSDLNSAYNRFAAAIPAYVCPYCKGVKIDGCKCCKGKGVISKFVWSTLPEELKK